MTDGLVWHVVAFKFKTDPASQVQIPIIIEAFSDLQRLSVDSNDSDRPLIQNFYYGQNNSKEQVSFGEKGKVLNRSTEYTFILTFRDVRDRNYYVEQEPAHQAFKKLVGPLLDDGVEGVFATDFCQR